jgi:molybdate transport system substrate-binding protein
MHALSMMKPYRHLRGDKGSDTSMPVILAPKSVLFRLAAIVLALAPCGAAARAEPPAILVFAAASLKNALDDAATAYAPARVTIAYAASGSLAHQIEAGAPAALFISADEEWMDTLAAEGLIDTGSRIDLLGNDLVLIAPATSAARFTFGRDGDLAQRLGPDRLAIGDPQSVPAGKYAEAALSKLGLWSGVAAHLALADSVRAALALVDRGEAPLGIVYRTDAAADGGVRILDTFPPDSHKPILYPAALVKGADASARAFLAWLHSPQATPYFTRAGFIVPGAS